MVENSQAISLFQSNRVEALSGLGGTDVDEMAFDYLKGIPYYNATFVFNAT